MNIIYPGPTDVKYPPNVGRGLSSADLEVDRLYEPKQNKKIVRSVIDELRNIFIHNIEFQNLHSDPVHVLSLPRCHPPLPVLCLPLEESSHNDH